jgi:putative flippase GtrA
MAINIDHPTGAAPKRANHEPPGAATAEHHPASPGPDPFMTTFVTPEKLTVNAGSGVRARLARCLGVSVVSTAVCFAALILLTAVFGVAAALANVFATAIATVPSYHLNRRWTWGRRDRSDPWRELLPFWVLAFCGLALSTVTVAIADGWAASLHLVPVLRTATVLVSHLGGFGALWILQFVLLDRVLFGRSPSAR